MRSSYPAESKTWVEISSANAGKNLAFFRKLVGPKVKIFSVVKSNAYGHGLVEFSGIMEKKGIDGFCVDSVSEGLELRESGIVSPILVLGYSSSSEMAIASEADITVTVSNKDALADISLLKEKPDFHLKIDTGMRRQGFYPDEIAAVAKTCSKAGLANHLKGIYTHFAAAKDLCYPTFTEIQFDRFMKACEILKRAGFSNILRHASATGGTLLEKKYRLDAVRIGIGLYGLSPSKELELTVKDFHLKPVLSFKSVIAEIKKVKKGDYAGYDLSERLSRDSFLAVIPVGYWHGIPRALSSIGKIFVGGEPARIIGRVSMDMIVVDVTGLKAKRGDIVEIVKDDSVYDMAASMNASYYELLTRINPIIERRIV